MAKTRRRYYRTVILGVLALAALVWMAVDQFQVPRQEIEQLMVGSVLAVILVILSAALTVLLWAAVRRLWRKLSGSGE